MARPIRGDTRTQSRSYRLEGATIATIERLSDELGLSHAQVVARAVAALAGDQDRQALVVEVERAEHRGRRRGLEDALAAEVARSKAQ